MSVMLGLSKECDMSWLRSFTVVVYFLAIIAGSMVGTLVVAEHSDAKLVYGMLTTFWVLVIFGILCKLSLVDFFVLAVVSSAISLAVYGAEYLLSGEVVQALIRGLIWVLPVVLGAGVKRIFAVSSS